MKKIITKKFILTTFICIVTIAEGLLFYNKLPDEMATHFTFSGVPNRYSDKNFAVFFIPLLLAALNILITFSLEYSEKSQNRTKLYRIVYTWLCPVLAVVIQTSVILFALGINLTQISLIIITLYILLLIFASIRKED